MNALVVYDAAGSVVSVMVPDPEMGGQIEAVPGDGESVLTIDTSTLVPRLTSEADQAVMELAQTQGEPTDALAVYDAAGSVVSVMVPDPEMGGQIEAVLGDGESVVTLDPSTMAPQLTSEADQGFVAMLIATGHSVDATTGQLVQKT